MRWMIRGCELFFLPFNFARGEEEGGREVDVLFTMFLIRKDTNKFLPESSCTSSQSVSGKSEWTVI